VHRPGGPLSTFRSPGEEQKLAESALRVLPALNLQPPDSTDRHHAPVASGQDYVDKQGKK